MHCNALHVADGTIPLLLGVMGVHTFFVQGDLTFDLDIQTSPNETKHVFPVNMVQICSAVPEIFDSETKRMKKSQAALKTEPYSRAVKMKVTLVTVVTCNRATEHVTLIPPHSALVYTSCLVPSMVNLRTKFGMSKLTNSKNIECLPKLNLLESNF